MRNPSFWLISTFLANFPRKKDLVCYIFSITRVPESTTSPSSCPTVSSSLRALFKVVYAGLLIHVVKSPSKSTVINVNGNNVHYVYNFDNENKN